MKFYNVAAKNIKGNLYRYIMYYLSNVFSVMVFFIFANFIFHPAVVSGEIPGVVAQALKACEFVIMIFTLFFVGYANSTFMKSRGREFGLLSMFGMTKWQIKKYVIYESIIVSVLSIAAGILFGGLFSRLFFMAIGSILKLGMPIKFMIVKKAVGITAGSFFILFQVITLFSLRKIKSKDIINQMKESKVPKPVPHFSKPFAFTGALMLILGYGLAWFSGMYVILTMFPILFLVVTGTYYLFTQLSIAVTQRLRENKTIFYRKTNMLVISQIIYKLKDNARILFLISTLGAVTLTAAGMVYSFYTVSRDTVMDNTPQAIGFVEEGIKNHNIIHPDRVKEILKGNGVVIEEEHNVIGIKGENSSKDKSLGKRFFIMSNSDYNMMAEKCGKKKVFAKEGEAIFMQPYTNIVKDAFDKEHVLQIKIGDTENKFNVSVNRNGGVINSGGSKYKNIFVISDGKYNNIRGSISDDKLLSYYGYDIKNWEDTTEGINQVIENVPEKYRSQVCERVTTYNMIKMSGLITMLIGLFIALLFFIATGSIIYFKLFTELKEDRAEFEGLRKMGMSRAEMKRIVNTQMAILFFLPFVVAVLHSSFALKILADILNSNLIANGLMVIGIYFVFQFIYFMIIKIMYAAQMKWDQ